MKTKKIKDCCEVCHFWQLRIASSGCSFSPVGNCRECPPVERRIVDGYETIDWPVQTRGYEWCGKFKPKNEVTYVK